MNINFFSFKQNPPPSIQLDTSYHDTAEITLFQRRLKRIKELSKSVSRRQSIIEHLVSLCSTYNQHMIIACEFVQEATELCEDFNRRSTFTGSLLCGSTTRTKRSEIMETFEANGTVLFTTVQMLKHSAGVKYLRSDHIVFMHTTSKNTYEFISKQLEVKHLHQLLDGDKVSISHSKNNAQKLMQLEGVDFATSDSSATLQIISGEQYEKFR
jgi:hypothetical protein